MVDYDVDDPIYRESLESNRETRNGLMDGRVNRFTRNSSKSHRIRGIQYHDQRHTLVRRLHKAFTDVLPQKDTHAHISRHIPR